MAGIDNASKFRSKEDEERLRRQKAKNPTNINRARELAKQYSNPYKFNNTVTVTKRIDNEKWYAGDKPTARETYARIYQVAGDDQNKMKELQSQYAQEIANPGSVIYNPYAQATNTKAINGLRELGIDVPDVITDQWVDKMWGEYGQYGRQTTTSYGPSAPTTKSTRENDIAYWVSTLMEDKENTNLAEAQMKSLYDEVAYLTNQGYSDNEIVKRVRNEFGSKYNVLNKMDEERMIGSAVRLNRAVNYSGDDTLYGMIWAARNDGGTGDYFSDAVNYAMGNGKKYKADPNSEAALDPSNYEGFAPYSRGSTLDDMNQKYGVNDFNQEWLDSNRSMLNDPEQAKDWRKIEGAVQNADKAASELDGLNRWLDKMLASGENEQAIADALKAALAGDKELSYKDEEGHIQKFKPTTLGRMEESRARGEAMDLGYGVDFSLPAYLSKVSQMVIERDEAAAAAAVYNAKVEDVESFGSKVGRFFASMDVGVGSYGGNIDSVLKAKKGTYTEDEFARKFISDTFGIDYSGSFSPMEQAAVKDALEKVEIATNAKATTDEIIAANDAIDGLIGLMGQVANDPSRQVADESYADRESWTSVINSTADEPREGMAGFVPELTSFTGENGEEQVDLKAEQEAALNAYAAMCQGGEWNTDVINWAMSRSDNPAAIRIEITQGIIDHVQTGAPLTGLTKSWWDKFGGLVDNTGAPGDINAPGMTSSTLLYYADSNPESYDSRNAYGTSVYRAIKMNEDAYRAGVIEGAEYANNLWALSAIADGVNQAADGERATDEIANAFLDESGYGMVLESMYQNINDRVLAGAKDRAMKRDQQIQENSEVIQRAISGQMLESDFPVYVDIVSADVGKIAARDKTYQAANAYIAENLGFDAIAESGMQFTYGDKAVDASYGPELVLNEGASVYSKGVTALAQEQLELHMKFAAACMMSLEEFYQKFPSYARTPEQLVAEAKEEYNGTWKEFGKTIDGLIQANESIFSPNAAEGEDVVSNGELGPGTVFALGYDKVVRGNDLNLAKTLYFMRYAWKDEEYEKEQLLSKYGGRAGFAAELDRFVSEREAGLRNEYENDALARMNNLTYEQWLVDHNDPVLDEVLAKRGTAKDILEVGDPARLAAEDDIAQKIQNVAYVDKTVSEYGSEYDKKLFEATTMIMQTGQFMYTTAMLGGGYVGSLASMLTSSGGDAYDRFIESGDYDSALLATTAAWLVNAAIEKMSYDRFMPEGLGGRRGVRMAKVQSMLAREGVYSIMKDPNKLSQAAVAVLEGLAVHGVSSGGEGLEEYLQQIVDSLADNVVYGTDYILSQEQQAAAGQAFWSGAAMGVLFSSVSSSMFGRPKVTNRAGQAIEKAEAELLPETEGVKLNDAITFEATNMAYVNSTEALAQIEDSSENAAKKKAEQDLKDASAELAEAQEAQAAAKGQHAAAALALEEVNIEMQDAEAFTEEMSKRMVTAAEALTKAEQDMDSANARLEAAVANQAKLQEAFDAAKGKVQQMYNSVMDAAKAKYIELVTEKYYDGDTPEQRKAGMAYQAACKYLEDAKNILLEAKANLSKQTEGTAQADEAHIAHGEAVIAVNNAVDAVEATKAEMEAAYANAVEQTKSDVNDSLSRAQQAADQAAAIAAADPANTQKQLAAQHAQAQVNTISAKQALEDRRADLSIRLKSADDTERAAAVTEWKELQQAVNDAESELNALEAEFNETNPQKNLRAAIDKFKEYTNEQLLFADEEGHEDAVAAYNSMQLARADAEVANKLDKLNGTEKGGSEYDAALKEYNDALTSRENEIGTQMGVDGDTVREMMRKAPESAQILDAVNTGNSTHAISLMKRMLVENSDRRVELAELSTLEDVENASVADLAENLVTQLDSQKDNASAISDLLDSYSSQMWSDPRKAAKTGTQTTAKSNPIEILRNLSRSLNVHYIPGAKVPRAIQGFYNKHANIIASSTREAGDLAVGLHEFGHAIQARLPGLEANDKLISSLSNDVRKAYDKAEWGSEALSEFVVSYIFDPESAEKLAGKEFVREFENQIRQDKVLYKAIMDASNKVELWNNADAGSKIRATTKDSYNPERAMIGGKLSSMLRTVQTQYLDMTAAADLVSRNFRKQVLYNTYANKRSDVVLSQWLTDPSTNQKIGNSLAERLYDAGVAEGDMDAMVEFALARHAIDRRAQNKDVFDEHEFPTSELESVVSKYKGTNIEKGADAMVQFWNDFADAWLVGTGIIDQSTMDTMRKMYPHYVPTYRVIDPSFNTAPYGGSSSVFKLHRAVEGGSSLEVINPMVSLVTQVQKVVNTVSRNQMMQSLHAEMQKGGLSDVAKLVTKEEIAERADISSAMSALEKVNEGGVSDPESMENLINELNDLALRFVGSDRGVGKNTITGTDQYGNRFYYDVLDPDLYNLLANNFKSAKVIPEELRKIKNGFTALTTSSNPFFAIKNMQRDFQSSVNTGTWATFYADGMAKWVKAFAEVLSQSDSYKQWKAMGGGGHTRFQSAMTQKDAGRLAGDVAKAVLRGKKNSKGEFTVDKTALDKISNVFTFEALNGAIEDASRFAEWRFGKHDLSTEEGRIEAFMRSQDVTTNFGTHAAAQWVNAVGNFVPFMNATLQGLNKDINIIGDLLFSKDAQARAEARPKAAKIVMNTALTATAQYMLLKMFTKGKEDDEDYALLNDAMKAGNIIIPIPKAINKGLQNFSGFNKPYIRIPVAQGVLHQGLYASAIDIISNVANYGPMEVDLVSALGTIMLDSLPMDGSVFSAVADAANNKTWYGGQIESSYMQGVSNYNRYGDDVPQSVIDTARLIGVSPAKLNYLLNQYGGAIAKVAMPLLGDGSAADRGKALFNSILSNYTIDPTSSNDLSNNFDAAMTLLQETVNEGNRGLPLGHISYGVDAEEAYAAAEELLDLMTTAKKEINALYGERSVIKDSETMSEGDKARNMRDIRRNQINPIYEEYLAEYELFKMQYVANDLSGKNVLDLVLDALGSTERPTLE